MSKTQLNHMYMWLQCAQQSAGHNGHLARNCVASLGQPNMLPDSPTLQDNAVGDSPTMRSQAVATQAPDDR
jgi:hypothetical protein